MDDDNDWDFDDDDEYDNGECSIVIQVGDKVEYDGEELTCAGYYFWEGSPTYYFTYANGEAFEAWYDPELGVDPVD